MSITLSSLVALLVLTSTASDREPVEAELEEVLRRQRTRVEQTEPQPEQAHEFEVAPSITLWGPRFGVTAVIGEEGKLLRERLGVRAPVLSQFGWQFEHRFFEQESGWTGVNEFVLMIGGLEQGTVLPTLTWITGVRTPFGFEMGAGPTINFVQMANGIDRGRFGFGRNPGNGEHRSLEGIGVAIAAGMSIPVGDITFPLNLAVVPNRDGVRLTLLVGFSLPSEANDEAQ